MSRLLGLSRRELVALSAVFVLTLPAVTPRIYASDEIQYFSYLRSLWFDHDVSFENEYRYFYDRNIGRGENFHATFLELRTDTGRRPNFGTMGSAILWMPFYAAGDVVARLTGADADGFSRPYVAGVAYGSAFYGFAAVVLGAAAARMILRHGSAWSDANQPSGPGSARIDDRGIGLEVIAAILVWFGTPLLFYMYIAPPYAHACSAFAVALFILVWLHVRRAWSVRGAVALALCGALMAMVREQDLFFALGAAADFAITAARALRSGRQGPHALSLQARIAAAGFVAFAIGYAPQLLAYSALNGYPGPSKLVVRKMIWHSPHALQVLGSPEHGFLLWTPLAILAIAGLALLAWRGAGDRRRIGAILLLMLALQIYVSGSVDSWSAAGAFGQRRFVAVTALLTIGMAVFLRALPIGFPRAAAGFVIGVCVWWNLALIAAFGTGLMNRQRLELARNAYDAFVTIPRMGPELAMRYLTSRDSFYENKE
jgi:hypothetical protein